MTQNKTPITMTISLPVQDEKYLWVPFWVWYDREKKAWARYYFRLNRGGAIYNLIIYLTLIFGIQSPSWYVYLPSKVVATFTAFICFWCLTQILLQWQAKTYGR